MGRHLSRAHRVRRARRHRRARRGASLVLVLATLVAGLTAPAWAAVVSCGSMTVPVLQRINPQTSASIDTTWLSEALSAESRYGFTTDPGSPVYRASWDPGRGMVGIHRLYHRGDFRMLPPGRDLRAAVAAGYVDQGIWFYASSTRRIGCVGVHTYTKGARHRMAAAPAVRAGLAAQGWRDRGVAYWAAPGVTPTPPATGTTSLPTSTTPPPTTPPTTTTVPATTTSTSSSTSTSSTTVPPVPSTTSTTATGPSSSTTTSTGSTTSATPTSTSTSTVPPTTTTTTSPPPPDAPAPGAFTIAVLPDTQDETTRGATYGRFEQRARWLVEHRKELDLAFVGSSGDVTNWGWLDPSQFEVVSRGMQTIEDAGIPYALALGNHDTRAVGWDGVSGSTGYGGSAYQSNPECVTRFPAGECVSPKLVRHTEEFNQTFSARRYGAVGGAFEPGKVDNIFSTFSAGGHRWLVLTLELWARPEVVQWAGRVVEQHPDHNVIIQTHHYLNGDGRIGQDNGGYGATSPQYLFDHLVSQYANIKMVFSGHVGAATSRTDRGVHGNTVYSFLECFHDKTTNPVRLVSIDPAAGTIGTRVTVPWTGTTLSQYSASWSGVDFVG